MMENNENLSSFEEAFVRVEEILEKISSGNTPLEESLKLFEEADYLIKACNNKLNKAEQKVDLLIKNRDGTLKTDSTNKIETQEYQRDDQHVFASQKRD